MPDCQLEFCWENNLAVTRVTANLVHSKAQNALLLLSRRSRHNENYYKFHFELNLRKGNSINLSCIKWSKWAFCEQKNSPNFCTGRDKTLTPHMYLVKYFK